MRVVRELTGAPAASLTPETPLMEAGVDSLAATELSSRLRSLTGVALSPTIVFEQPTPRAVAAHLLEQASPPAAASASLGAVPDAADAGVALALVGGTGRWAGGGESHLARWRLQLACADAMGSVPLTRWALEEIADTRALTSVQAACVRHGGFVGGAQRFDAAAFSLSLAEAGAMDPQQRLLLELGYAALHGSSQRRITLMGCDVGVLLGIERPDWALAQPPLARGSVYAVTGDNVSAAAGRVSFALGLQGPCSSVDTACSSALAAVHWGGYAIRGGESRAALALAVSLKLTPHGTLGAASAGMLSVDGRCKTLDARANGYARSEGVGALVLREGSGAALRLCGSAVRQDGRSASLTAPNGSAQRTLLVAALERATLGAFDVGSIEAHGTGTALGDPTEAGALAAVHGAAENPRSIVVGAAKASVGHTEASSGQVGLLRLSEMADVATGNAHLRSLNPLVGSRLGSRAGCFVLSSQAVSSQLACGVSSFGYSGTIAHAVLAFGSGGDREALAFGRDPDASEALAFGSRGAEAAGGGVFGAKCSAFDPRPALVYRRRAFPWRDATSSAGSARTLMYSTCWATAAFASTSPPMTRLLMTTPSLFQRGGTPAVSPSWQTVAIMLLEAHGSAAPSLHGMHPVLALAQQLAGRIEPPPRVVMLTCGALAFGGAPSDAAHGGAWGFARVLRLEHAALRTQSADVGRGCWSEVSACRMLLAPTSEAEAAWPSGSHAVVARLRACTTASNAHASLAVGAYAITGGLGGLGLRAAAMLVDGGASRVASCVAQRPRGAGWAGPRDAVALDGRGRCGAGVR